MVQFQVPWIKAFGRPERSSFDASQVTFGDKFPAHERQLVTLLANTATLLFRDSCEVTRPSMPYPKVGKSGIRVGSGVNNGESGSFAN